jgi:hypothetical protein
VTRTPAPSADPLAEEGWVISSYSSGSGECVEVKRTPAVVAVRDSKDRSGGTLTFPTAGWRTFLVAVKTNYVDVT